MHNLLHGAGCCLVSRIVAMVFGWPRSVHTLLADRSSLTATGCRSGGRGAAITMVTGWPVGREEIQVVGLLVPHTGPITC